MSASPPKPCCRYALHSLPPPPTLAYHIGACARRGAWTPDRRPSRDSMRPGSLAERPPSAPDAGSNTSLASQRGRYWAAKPGTQHRTCRPDGQSTPSWKHGRLDPTVVRSQSGPPRRPSSQHTREAGRWLPLPSIAVNMAPTYMAPPRRRPRKATPRAPQGESVTCAGR
ncbi:hypothetical protein LX36DRAFT_661737 [Colletotrichum falcatum]|nr:hypothetical protein LX36DRAFT_661737 [Colletotrichum falcatum]